MSNNLFSNIRIFPVKGNENLLANGQVLIAGTVQVSFTIRRGKNGPFAALPTHKGKDKEGNDKWYPDVYLPDENVRKQLQVEVMAAYNGNGAAKKPSGQASAGEENQYNDSIPF